MQFTAHIRDTDKTIQTVNEHCRNTAVLAERYLEDIGLGNVGRLVGMLHDAGKLTREFDDYINERICACSFGTSSSLRRAWIEI